MDALNAEAVYSEADHSETEHPEAPAAVGPKLAYAVVLLGFVAVFTVFATQAVASVVIGLVLIVAGALWAGAIPDPPVVGAAVGVEEPPGAGH